MVIGRNSTNKCLLKTGSDWNGDQMTGAKPAQFPGSSPFTILDRTAAAIFLAEVLAMIVVWKFQSFNSLGGALLDATLVVGFSAPLIYVAVLRSLSSRGRVVSLIRLSAIIFVTEFAVMGLISWMKLSEHLVIVSLLDASLLTAFSFHFIYLVIVRPLGRTGGGEAGELISETKSGNTHNQLITDRLKGLYMAALGLVGVLTISSQVLTQHEMRVQQSDAPVINIAGRQRMLSQKLTKISLALLEKAREPEKSRPGDYEQAGSWHGEYAAELRELTGMWRRSHHGLQNGDIGLNLPGNNTPDVAALFAVIEPHYGAIQRAAGGLIDALEEGAGLPEYSTHAKTIMEHEGAFLTGMNDIVFQYDARHRNGCRGSAEPS